MSNIKNLERLQKVNKARTANENTKSFSLKVNRYFTDLDGTVLDKNTMPSFAKTKYPVWMFGCFDSDGGYKIGQELTPFLTNGLVYIFHQTVNNFFDLLQFSGANNVKEKLQIGDHIIVFSDSMQFPSFFVWIVISGQKRAYGSILKNPVDTGFDIFDIKMFVDNDVQLFETLQFIRFDEIGNYLTDFINPQIFKTPDYLQDGFIELFVNYKLLNHNGIYFYIDFLCDEIFFEFKFNKLK